MAIFHYTVKIVGRSKGKSVRYKRSEDKEAALEKFKITLEERVLIGVSTIK